VQSLIVVAIVGALAQLVDGSLGMAYGVTSTTLLLSAGLAPAMASATVHLAEVGTTLASGASHLKLGNVDWRSVRWMALPGGIGAFLGAVLLTSISAEVAEPWVATFLFALGIYILVRFTLMDGKRLVINKPIAGRSLASLGLVAGFLDAAGGGGWGPIGTPTLLASRRMEPRKVVGTVDTSEFVVALCASVGFLLTLGTQPINWATVGAVLAGGLVAAPIAALLVRKMHPRTLGSAVGGVILLTNARTILGTVGASAGVAALTFVVIVGLWGLALGYSLGTVRVERAKAEPAVV
jgi:uncharacterized membrane protein YfcA